MRRRAAVEPVIGHLKDEHRMGRNYLKGRDGDRINAVLAAAGYNEVAEPNGEILRAEIAEVLGQLEGEDGASVVGLNGLQLDEAPDEHTEMR